MTIHYTSSSPLVWAENAASLRHNFHYKLQTQPMCAPSVGFCAINVPSNQQRTQTRILSPNSVDCGKPVLILLTRPSKPGERMHGRN